MIGELRVEHLGVIDDLHLVLGPGMTVITGETGAGKTLIVEALGLLLGGRADAGLVGPGAAEARVEARVLLPAELVGDDTGGAARRGGDDPGDDGLVEAVLARVVPKEGRSRGYLDGRLATAGGLAELGRALVDLHGQHDHVRLAAPAAQREALDDFAGAPVAEALADYRSARADVARLRDALDALGGDERSRAREADVLAHQVAELDAAAIADAEEDDRLAAEAELLADAGEHRAAADAAHRALADRALDALGDAVRALAGRAPFTDASARLDGLWAEVDDLATELRRVEEAVVDDPARLEAVQDRRKLLADLRRRYGDTLAEVLAERDRLAAALADLLGHEERAARLQADLGAATARADAAAARLREERREAAARLGPQVTRHLRELAMPKAALAVSVEEAAPGEWGADLTTFLLAANPGLPPAGLGKVASGGELARCMLALRLVLGHAPPVQVFDEVDAGIGGEAGLAVGAQLQALARGHQVLCVTHLAQVAAHADRHVVVRKETVRGRTRALARVVEGDDRIAELARMLGGSTSAASLAHAADLLARVRPRAAGSPARAASAARPGEAAGSAPGGARRRRAAS